MTLYDALLYLVSGGSGAIVYWLMENAPVLKNIQGGDYKRYAAWILSAVIPLLAWGAMIGLGYRQVPATVEEAASQVFALLLVAFSTNQGLHAALKLRPKSGQ